MKVIYVNGHTMRTHIQAFIICLSYIFCFSLNAEENFFDKYNFSHLTKEAGLPSNYIRHIIKDSQEYIWIATNNGVARYDGYTVTPLTTTSSPVAIKSNYVHKLCEDNYNRLWIASEKGIDVIDPDQHTSITLNISQHKLLSDIFHSHSTAIYKSSNGDLWISYKQSLLCLEFDRMGRVAKHYTIKDGESKRTIKAVIDIDGIIYAGVNGTVVHVRKEDNHLLSIEPLPELSAHLFEKRAIQCMETDGDELWIGTNRGLFKYNWKRKEVQAYTSALDVPDALSQLDITDIKKEPSGEIIIATLNGLNQYNKKNNSFSFIRKTNKKSVNTLNCNQINCILAEQHQIWVGTENGGVNILSKGRLSTYNWVHDDRDPESLSPNPVNAICEDSHGNLWIGTKEGGLNVKRRGENVFKHYVKEDDKFSSISDNSITAMIVDRENQLWICTWGKGVNRFDFNNTPHKIKQYHRESTPCMNGDFAHSVCEDSINNGIWFGTTNGLYFFNKKDETFKQIEFNLPSNNFDSMRGLCIDKQRRLWVGTSIGLFVIDLLSFTHNQANFDYIHIDHKLTDHETHPDKVNCIVEDREGNIWIGTNGNGLYRFIGEKEDDFAFKNYTTINGLPNNTILGIVDDRLGNLWLSTDMGISRLSKDKEIFSNYTKDDGLLTNQFYFNAFFYSELDNIIYFGNTEGLIAVDPTGKIKNNAINSKVSISRITISGNVIYPSSGNYISHHIANATDVFLHEKERTFSFDFTTKAYGLNHLIRYAYRLKGYEEEWNEGKIGEHMAIYASVPAGSYVFQVKATNDNGHWSDEITELKLHIVPYYYKTWWFMLLVVTTVLLFFYLFYAWKTKTYRIQNEKLEEKVKRRTEKLDEQNKQLLEMSRILANTTEEKITFFTNVTHEFRTPVTLIQGPLEKALHLSKEPAVTEQLQMAKRNSANLLTLVNELLDFRKLEVNKITLRKSSGHYKEFLEQTLMPLKAYARDKQITISTYYRVDTMYIIYDYDNMHKLIVNLVSNAIKYTPKGGKIKIYSATQQHNNAKQLYISVCDNGAGIAKEDVERVFDYYYQSNNNVATGAEQNSTGIGLYLCKSIVEMHEGNIKAVNNKAGGTSFRIILPQVTGEKEERIKQENRCAPISLPTSKEQKESILLVDDNEDMRTYIDTLLRPYYRITQASNGEEALLIINQTSIDLIISDLMMPVMDGFELSQRVKEDIAISHIPFIMLTALVSEEQRKISYRVGVDMYLCKPFDEKELLLRIQNIFSTRKTYRSKFAAELGFDSFPMREGSKDKNFIDAAISLMKKHYSNSEYEVTVFIADLGYSKTQVNRKFNDLLGQSTGQFMRNYRLNMAHELLKQATRDTDINISEVAYAVGFSDPKYFTRCFKEFFGILPSSLLKRTK